MARDGRKSGTSNHNRVSNANYNKSNANRSHGGSYENFISNGFYSYNSQALQVVPDEEPDYEYEPRPHVKKKPKHHKRILKKGKLNFDYDIQVSHKSSFMSYLVLIVFVAGALLSTMTMAKIAAAKVQLNAKRAELSKVQDSNYALQAEIYDNYNLEEIEAVATSRLNMAKPEEYQMVYIDVTEQSYFVQHEDLSKPIEDSFSFARVFSTLFEGDSIGQTTKR